MKKTFLYRRCNLRWGNLFIFTIFAFSPLKPANAQKSHADCIVDASGHGDYRSIQSALDSLPMYPYQRTVILIRNGVYPEKVRITRNYITLVGESGDSTIIRYAQLRTDWEKNRDWFGPGIVNIDADDIVLENLTIENSQTEIGPHAFAVYGTGTRIILNRCTILSKGGDTVALWDYKTGMSYASRCVFQGAVDFVCPRGWCLIRDSRFFEIKQTAALWHAGHYDPDQKFVLMDCAFDGVEGFKLGRNHYDSQFMFIRCRFSGRMADQPVYRNLYDDPSRNNPVYFGDRVYFDHCTKEGEDFPWIHDSWPESPNYSDPDSLDSRWVFDGMWNPESDAPLRIDSLEILDNGLRLYFDDQISIRNHPVLVSETDRKYPLQILRFTDNVAATFLGSKADILQDLNGIFTMENGAVIGSTATVRERTTEPEIDLRSVKQIRNN